FEAQRDMERDGAVVTASLVDELAPARGRRLIVFDDLQWLDEAPAATRWLARLIEATDPAVAFLVTCRGECPLPLERLDLHGGSLVLRAEDLRFTPDEQSRLLRRVRRHAGAEEARWI